MKFGENIQKTIVPIFKILGSKHIGVTSLTFRDHVTSSTTDPLIPSRPFPIGGHLEPSLSNGFRDIQWRI